MDHPLPIDQRIAPQDEFRPWRQHTLKSSISCVGVAVHSGRRVSLTLRPAEANHGIAFRRTDLGRTIPARFDHVVDTRLATVIGDATWASARVVPTDNSAATHHAATRIRFITSPHTRSRLNR